jgi:GxxExxY protein
LVHPFYEKADQLSHAAIGAAIEVHRVLGSGLIESIYERCLLRELSLGQITNLTLLILLRFLR